MWLQKLVVGLIGFFLFVLGLLPKSKRILQILLFLVGNKKS